MAEPEEFEFQVLFAGKRGKETWATVEGYIFDTDEYKVIGVHPDITYTPETGANYVEGVWAITHLPTGYSLFSYGFTKTQALLLARKIMAHGWHHADTDDWYKASHRLIGRDTITHRVAVILGKIGGGPVPSDEEFERQLQKLDTTASAPHVPYQGYPPEAETYSAAERKAAKKFATRTSKTIGIRPALRYDRDAFPHYYVARPGLWVVTHIPSGRALTTGLKMSKPQAAALAKRLIQLGWERTRLSDPDVVFRRLTELEVYGSLPVGGKSVKKPAKKKRAKKPEHAEPGDFNLLDALEDL